jgi:hypothetical protein
MNQRHKMNLPRIACFCLCALQFFGVANASDQKQWLAFAPSELVKELKPLAERRTKQGWQTSVIESNGTADGLLKKIRKRSQLSDGPTVVLLCGSYGFEKGSAKIPFSRGKHGRMKLRPTDYTFGFPDKDGVATIAVGRLPARNPVELRAMIQKMIRFEDQAVGPWTHRLNLIVADPGGASAMERRFADVIVQSALGSRITSLHPRWRTTCIADTSNSQFAVEANRFGMATTSMFSDGQLFSCYCGHSGPAGLWSRQGYVVPRNEFMKMSIKDSTGIFVSCGCFGCQISGRDGQGYALSAVQNPNGPVAAIGAYGESYAALGQLALDGLMKSLNQKTAIDTLGDYWLGVQRGLAHGKINGLTFWLYDQADGSGGRISLADQRKEHLEMWTLLGDPALRLPILSDAPVTIDGEFTPGKTISIQMPDNKSPDNTQAAVSLEYRFRRPIDKPGVIAEKAVSVSQGMVTSDFELPDFNTTRDVVLRVIVTSKQERIQGTVLVKRKKEL